MPHNVSRAKQDEIKRERRLAALRPHLVPGWRLDPATFRIVPVETVLGHHQRNQHLFLRCRRPDCRRRVEVDFNAAVRAGLGDRPPFHLIHMLKCQHWNGCQLEEASAIYPKGVPLVAYLADRSALISIACTGCEARLLLPPVEVIERLKAAGRGDASTGIIELGSRIRGPCRTCGGRRFACGLAPSADVPSQR